MSREVHVRFCERPGGQSPRATRLVVLARYQGDRLREWIETTLEGRFGLTLNREKTKVVQLGEIGGASLDFLGFSLRYERSVLGTRGSLHVGPSRKSMARIREKLHALTASRSCYKSAVEVVGEVNRLLTGWGNYFSDGHPRRAFAAVNFQTQTRLRIHLHRRSQRGCRPPSGRTLYSHLYHYLGLKVLRPPS